MRIVTEAELGCATEIAMNWREILNKAASFIETRGLAKTAFSKPDGSICTAGALRMAAGLDPDPISDPFHSQLFPFDQPALNIAANQFAMHNGLQYSGSICGWNNAPERTAEEVANAMRFVAERA